MNSFYSLWYFTSSSLLFWPSRIPGFKQETLENKVYACPGNVAVDKKLQQLLAPLALSDDQR